MKKILTALLLAPILVLAQTNSFNILDRNAPTITGGTIDGATVGATTPGSVAATTLTSSGQAILTGTATNDSAAAGKIGQIITSTIASGSPITVNNATGVNITSISLTAGDWDVNGQVNFILTGVTATLFQSAISLTSNTLPSQAGGSGLGTDPLVGVPLLTTVLSSTYQQSIPVVRVSIASTTTVYLVAQCAFSVGTNAGYGTIRARRVR